MLPGDRSGRITEVHGFPGNGFLRSGVVSDGGGRIVEKGATKAEKFKPFLVGGVDNEEDGVKE